MRNVLYYYSNNLGSNTEVILGVEGMYQSHFSPRQFPVNDAMLVVFELGRSPEIGHWTLGPGVPKRHVASAIR